MERDEIESCLREVGEYLQADDVTGEILIVGGAYMTLVLRQRDATKDVDAYFASQPEAIRAAASRVARDRGLPVDWLNDAVKGFFFVQPDVTPWRDFAGLRVYAPDPAYVFAMKVHAGRPQDRRDLEALRDTLGLTNASDAVQIVTRFLPAHLLTARVQYVIEDLFDDDPG